MEEWGSPHPKIWPTHMSYIEKTKKPSQEGLPHPNKMS
jgi:hypothetical protein